MSRSDFPLAEMRRQAMKAKKAYDKFYRLLDEHIEHEMSRPPQGGRRLVKIEAEMRALESDDVRLAIADEQFAERITNMWANVAQAELAAEAAERELRRLPEAGS